MKIKDWKSFNFNNCRALSKDLDRKIIEGDGAVPIEMYSVFTKQSDSHQCPRCQGIKANIKELYNQFRGYFYPFYIDLMVNSNYGFLYDSRNKKNEYFNIEKSFS